MSSPREIAGWLLLSLAAAVVAAGLGLVAFAAFALPGHLDGAHGLGSRSAQLVLAFAVPVCGLVAACMSDAAVRLPRRRERPPGLGRPLLALAGAALAFAGWAALYFG